VHNDYTSVAKLSNSRNYSPGTIPMPYTTPAALLQRLEAGVLAGLADDLHTPPDIDAAQTQAVLVQAISDGATLIDSILGARVDLPELTADPSAAAALERLNATLALYELFQRRCLDAALNPLATPRALALAHLRSIARGEATLGGDAEAAPQQPAWSSTEERAPGFSREQLKRFG
jgi:phage gp36-like protein